MAHDKKNYSEAKKRVCNLRRNIIRPAKAEYKRKMEDPFYNKNVRQVWQGFHQITNYKSKNVTPIDGTILMAEELSHFFFFACFEVEPSEAAVPQPLNYGTPPHCRGE